MVDDYALCPRECVIRKKADFQGYGFNLHAERGRAGQYIGKVDEGSPAASGGLKEGDRIVEVNGTNIGNENHSQVVERIRGFPDEVTMLVVDNSTDAHFKDQKIVVRGEMAEVVRIDSQPRPEEQEENQETENDNDKNDAIDIEGSDHDAASSHHDDEGSRHDDEGSSHHDDEGSRHDGEGSRHEDEGSHHGDTSSNHEEEEADDKPDEDEAPPTYERDPSPEPIRVPTPEPEVTVSVVKADPSSTPYNPRLCKISKRADFQGYGFNLHAEKDNTAQFIGKIDDDSPSEDAGLKQGDRIVEVNGDNIEDLTHSETIGKIKMRTDSVDLLVVDREADDYFKNNGIKVHSGMSQIIVGESRKTSSSTGESSSKYIPRECHVIKWHDFNGYGFNLHAEKATGAQFIGKIDNASPAQDADLREADRIIAVNGVNIEEETHQRVIELIKAGGDETRLLVVDKEADQYYKSQGITVSSSTPNVKFNATTRRSGGSTQVTNGDRTQPARSEPAQASAPAANGSVDVMELGKLSAKEMRERLASKKKSDAKSKGDFRSKYEIFQKL